MLQNPWHREKAGTNDVVHEIQHGHKAACAGNRIHPPVVGLPMKLVLEDAIVLHRRRHYYRRWLLISFLSAFFQKKKTRKQKNLHVRHRDLHASTAQTGMSVSIKELCMRAEIMDVVHAYAEAVDTKDWKVRM